MINQSQVVNMNAIRYTQLDKMTAELFPTVRKPKDIHIYLDLNKILSRFFSNSQCKLERNLLLASDIINLSAHYSQFFNSFGLKVINHIVYGSYNPEYNTNLISQYNINKIISVSNDTYSQNIINENLKIMETVISSIPNLYLNTTRYEVGVLIHDIINRNKDSLHIVITSDQYNYQLVNNKSTFIFRPYKSTHNNNRNDESYFISQKNLISTYCKEKKLKTNADIGLNPGLYSLILALSGCSCRDIVSLGRTDIILKKLKDNISSQKLLNKYNSLQKITEVYNDNIEELSRRFCCIDIPVQYIDYKLSPDHAKVSFDTINDYDSLNFINNNYFEKFPIYINSF